MSVLPSLRSILLAAGGALALAACTQGDEIASPGPANPGTPPGGGGPGGPGGPGAAECPDGFAEGDSVGGLTTCDVSGTILSNLTLPFVQGVAYRINGRVDVGEDVGAGGSSGASATLTIEPGVTIFGASGADYLVVNRGSRILAEGEVNAPIVMTSANDLTRRAANPNDTGGDNIGEWGGLVVLGRAPINRCITGTPGTAQCEQIIEGITAPEALYGGAIADDDSGVLKYLQVRFAGFEIAPGNELNGLTMGGVGNGTTVEYVQVHNGSDDGIEMFGGTANLKYIVLTGNDDDSLDTDNGWNGGVQFVVITQRDNGGDNAMEMSSSGVAPATNPTIANFTVVGERTNAWRLNTGHIGRFLNGVVSYGAECFRWEGSAGDGNAAAYGGVGSDPTFNSVLFDCAGLTIDSPDTPAAVASVGADANNVIGVNSLAGNFFPGPNEAGVAPFDLTTLPGTFFEDTDYIGAFGPDETESNNWATGWTFGLFPEPSCPAGTTDTNATISGQKVCSVSGEITSDLRLTRGNLYELSGRVDIGVDVGADGSAAGGVAAELTIESGVTIFGASGLDYLLVNRGSKIFANGTRQNPIVFTSEADVRGTQTDPANTIGEWGGVVVLGRAPINRCIGGATPGTAACQQLIEGVTAPDALYGGAVADDDSGALRFVQIKYAGYELAPGNELNGLTMGGVGNETTVEYVQVHNGSDDGIEMFGGTANLKYIVLTGNDDDSLDTDNGWDGFAQFVIIDQRALGGDNAMEMSSSGVAPATNPTIANFTVVGDRTNAWRINSGHIGRFINGVVAYGSPCFNWEDGAGDGNPASYGGLGNDPTFNSVLLDCTALTGGATTDPTAATQAIAADGNNIIGANSLMDTFVNGPNEDGVTAFDLMSLGGAAATFFEDVDYIGAVRDANDRWWADWSCGLESGSDC